MNSPPKPRHIDLRFKKHLWCNVVSVGRLGFPGLGSKYLKHASKWGSARYRFLHKMPPLHLQSLQIFLSLSPKYSGIVEDASGHLIDDIDPAFVTSRSIILLKSPAGRCLATSTKAAILRMAFKRTPRSTYLPHRIDCFSFCSCPSHGY